jgi:hypothetical protein
MKERIRALEQSGGKGDRETATIIRRLKKAEDMKQLWKKLKLVRHKDNNQGVVRLEIPQEPDMDPKKCTDWQVVDVPTEIVQHLQRRNRSHFGQAHGTPFTVPPLSDQLGFSGDGDAAQQILTGLYDPSNFDASVQILLNHLKYTEATARNPCRPTISDADLCGKALIARHSFSTTADDSDLTPEFIERRDELNRKQVAIRHVRLALINYALERGYSYHHQFRPLQRSQ